ncbi:FecR family protein [Chitinophaga sp. XS-30]|uniref:FecR family protein n=1 Tax=Chitinophaga sp. XS-30 TaxID=2604421 RepID=UPI0011DDF580|nr:FecR family protein [Chitinophaga sp. XS-30]QEH43828.1 FecR family protein [Chitinophaga sp. XS-30]
MLSEKDKKYLQQVLERYESGRSTPAETHFVEVYLDYLDELNKDADPFQHLNAAARLDLEQEIKEKLLQGMRSETAPAPEFTVHRNTRFNWRIAAAVIFAVLGAATGWILLKQGDKTAETVVQVQDVLPGSDRAVLQLGNGQIIVLDTSHGQIIQNGALTVNNDSGLLNYYGKAAMAEYHTLSVPRGGQYKLQLPDGTDVWLNAASSITYPTAFTGAERIVEITGEAYFEVAKMKQKPFRVKSANGSEIEVLGTHFNVNAYADEPSVVATLLEGSIRFSKANKHYLMKPGQQARLNKAGEIDIISDINIDAVTAWRNGYFYFDGTDLQTVMRQIARWYDVTVTYEGKVPDMKFSGEISKSNNASLVLKMLEATRVRFEIEGNKIIVKP